MYSHNRISVYFVKQVAEWRCRMTPRDSENLKIAKKSAHVNLCVWLIDCMVLNAVFNSISVISRRPVHLSILSGIFFFFFYLLLRTIFCPSHWLLSHITNVETIDSGERGMNPVAVAIVNPRKECWPSRESNQRPPVLQSCTLTTDLWGLAESARIAQAEMNRYFSQMH